MMMIMMVMMTIKETMMTKKETMMISMIIISCQDNNRFPYETKKAWNDLNFARRPGPSDRLTDRQADRHTGIWRLWMNLKTAFQSIQ